jgi:hypothetical protein
MHSRLRGLISWILAAVYWLADRVWGDRIFAAVKPLIPNSLANPPLDTALPILQTYGPPLALACLGAYFFWRAGKNQKQVEKQPSDTGASKKDSVGAQDDRASTTGVAENIQSRRELAAHLDREFFSKGVGERNRVQDGRPIIDAAEYQREMAKLVEWSNRVQSLLDGSEHITVKEQSNFRTLYNLEPDNRIPRRGPFQTHLIQMWNRKLDVLRSIINRIGENPEK